MNVTFHRKFRKFYEKAPAKIRRQFEGRLRIFTADPFNPILNNHPLRGKYTGYWSINVGGDIRAVYRHRHPQEYMFTALGTHSKLYRK